MNLHFDLRRDDAEQPVLQLTHSRRMAGSWRSRYISIAAGRVHIALIRNWPARASFNLVLGRSVMRWRVRRTLIAVSWMESRGR